MAGCPLRLFVGVGAPVLLVVAVMVQTKAERLDRITTWLNPKVDPLDGGWQALHGKFALASGGWWGAGLGGSKEKWGLLPEAHTDFIFAIIGEELGLLGALLVLALFVAFATLGIRVALRAPDRFGALLAAGITMGIVGQAVINVGAVVGLLPITGIPLPFVSFGGTALITTMFAAGVLANIARQIRPTARPR